MNQTARVISIDYRWPARYLEHILDQVAAGGLRSCRSGTAHELGMSGESAGGCIEAAATMMLSERGLGVPAAMSYYRRSLTRRRRDTHVTLADRRLSGTYGSWTWRVAYDPGDKLDDPGLTGMVIHTGFPQVRPQVDAGNWLTERSVQPA